MALLSLVTPRLKRFVLEPSRQRIIRQKSPYPRALGFKAALLLFGRARSPLPYGKWPRAPQGQPGSKEPRRTELLKLREAQAILGPAPAGMPGRPRQRRRRGRRAGEPRREISASSELPRNERKNPAALPAFPWLQSFASPSTKRL